MATETRNVAILRLGAGLTATVLLEHGEGRAALERRLMAPGWLTDTDGELVRTSAVVAFKVERRSVVTLTEQPK